MKSFYTNGIGNQQTLTNSQDEKIPIYDTYSDAQSDLSNLEEGQIVGTKGAFNQMTLVDTVQSGNMNAVTSNAVANALGGTALKYKDIDFYMSNITFSQLANRVGYYSNLLKSDYFSNTDVILSAMIIKWSSVPIAIFCFDNNANNISIQCSDITYDTSATAYWTVRFVYIEN